MFSRALFDELRTSAHSAQGGEVLFVLAFAMRRSRFSTFAEFASGRARQTEAEIGLLGAGGSYTLCT